MEKINVAIVEDQKEFLDLWAEILDTTPGFGLSGTYTNLHDAVAGLPVAGANVVLMDIRLSPTESGIDCIRQIRNLCPDTNFMMFTVFDDENHVFEALKAGANSYILKKTSSERVLAAIRELYEGGSPMSPGIARKVLDFFHAYPPDSEQFQLKPLEIQILEGLSKGYYYKEIAPKLNMSEDSLKQRIYKIYKKLGVYNRTEAVNKYFRKV